MTPTLYITIGLIVALILSFIVAEDYDDMVIYALRFVVFAALWPVFLLGAALRFMVEKIKFGG